MFWWQQFGESGGIHLCSYLFTYLWQKDFLINFNTYPSHVKGEVLKQCPDVVAGIDLLHLHLCVYIAVIDKIDICNFHLKDQSKRGKDLKTGMLQE